MAAGNTPECSFNPLAGNLEKMLDKWEADPAVKKVLLDPEEAFINILENEFKMPFDAFIHQENISKGQLKGLQQRLDRLAKNAKAGKMSTLGKFAELFYTPQAFANSNPTISKLLNNYVHTSHYLKGNEARNNDKQKLMKDALRMHAKANGISDNSIVAFGKKITGRSAEQKMTANEEEINRLTVKAANGDLAAEKRVKELLNEEAALIKDTSMQSYAEMIGLIEGSADEDGVVRNGLTGIINSKLARINKQRAEKKQRAMEYLPDDKRLKTNGERDYFLKEDDFGQLLDKDGQPISRHMKDALTHYSEFMEDLYYDLSNGVNSYIDNVLLSQSSGVPKEKLKEMGDRLRKKLLPNQEKGFYPHFARGLNVDFMQQAMAHMEDVILASNRHFNSPVSFQKAVDDMDGFISGHTRKRDSNANPEDYSWNFPKVIKGYADNVVRFNYINQINLNSRKALDEVQKMYRDHNYQGGMGESVVEFIHDMHKTATGLDQVQNPVINNMVRTILGFEFVSKIGFNPRSAIRNLSQSLLNLVEWSPVQLAKTKAFFQRSDMREKINRKMEEIGILWKDDAPELQEAMGRTPGGHSAVRLNPETRKLEHVPITTLEKVADAASWLGGKSGVFTAMAENFNRKTTYKTAYASMYESLRGDGFYQAQKKKIELQRKEAGKKLPDTDTMSRMVEKARDKISNQYAINMTVGLHFDYNRFSKSKILRGKVGSIVGQFQHYSFKFFEYNWDKGRRGLNELTSGEFNGDDAWKLYRLGIAYFLAPTLATAITGLDVGNLIQHDGAEKLNKLGLLMTEDPGSEEVQKAFYGKGPVIGTIGAPLYSDLLNLGMATGLINMDDDSMLALLAGFDKKNANELSTAWEKDRTYAISRMLNVGVNRAIFRHLPQLAEGNLGWVVQSEMGMYPSKEAKAKQKLLQEDISPELFKLIKELEQRGR